MTEKKQKKSRPRQKGSKNRKKKADLFSELVHLSGLPAHAIKRELRGILEQKNVDIENLTLDQLRMVVASYLRKIMGGILDRTTHR